MENIPEDEEDTIAQGQQELQEWINRAIQETLKRHKTYRSNRE